MATHDFPATTATITPSDLPSAIDAAKLADGSVSNAEFQRLDGVTSGIQGQLDAKAATESGNWTTYPLAKYLNVPNGSVLRFGKGAGAAAFGLVCIDNKLRVVTSGADDDSQPRYDVLTLDGNGIVVAPFGFSAEGPIVMTGFPASPGNSVRCIHGAGGTTHCVHNVPTGGYHAWNINGSTFFRVASTGADGSVVNAASGLCGLGAGGYVAQAQLGSGSGGAGAKVLADNQTWITPAAPAFAAAASVYKTADQNLSVDAWTKLTFDVERFDLGGNFASNTFTAPTTGYIEIIVRVVFSTSATSANLSIAMYKNGTRIDTSRLWDREEAVVRHSAEATFRHATTAADTWEVYVRISSGGAPQVIGTGAVDSGTGMTEAHFRML